MVILDKYNFRLSTIHKIVPGQRVDFIDCPLDEGLTIEKRCSKDDDSFYVICIIKYNPHEESAGIVDDCCGRLLDVEECETHYFRYLYKVAKQLVEVANMEVD